MIIVLKLTHFSSGNPIYIHFDKIQSMEEYDLKGKISGSKIRFSTDYPPLQVRETPSEIYARAGFTGVTTNESVLCLPTL